MFEAGAESDSAPATGAPEHDASGRPAPVAVLRGDLFYFAPATGEAWLEPTFEDLEP
jgi:hypothetical protein